MQTWYWRSIQDFLLHPDKIFPISLQSADNSILFSWVSKYMHFLLTLRVRCWLTSNFNRGKSCNTEGPKKGTTETTKTRAHKHTTNIINQAIITYYCYSHNNMHAHLSTQISRKLRYCGLICCDEVHEDEWMYGRIGVNNATPSASSARQQPELARRRGHTQ